MTDNLTIEEYLFESDLNQGYECPTCPHLPPFETLFGFNKHRRETHGERLAPLAHPYKQQEG